MFLAQARSDAGGDRSPWGDFYFGPVEPPAWWRVGAKREMALPAVWACINVLAKSFAVMPFHLFEFQGARRVKRPDHWLYRLVNKAPNRFQSPHEWKMMMMGHLALRGNAFCQIDANGRGEITELLPLHPDKMQMDVLTSGEYRYLYTDQQGRQITYLRSEIWHIRGLSSDGYVGMSPIEVEREAIGEGLAMQSYASRFFANDARPSGWVEFDGRFADATARQKWRESWQESYSGKNARKVAVLEKGMKYHELKVSHADVQFADARERNLGDIARIFGVPQHKIGDLSAASKGNIEHQNIEFWTDTMHPLGKCIASSMEYNLLGTDTEFDCEFDIRPMMRGDGKARSERLNRLVLGGVMRPNEAREEEGYDPVPGGDKLLRPVNMATVNDDGTVDIPSGAADLPGGPTSPGGQSPDETDRTAPESRMAQLLQGNAARMARRIASGNVPTPDVLADALAIDLSVAAGYLSGAAFGSEADIAGELVALATEGEE